MPKAEEIKSMRDMAYKKMTISRMSTDKELYKRYKAEYSQLCADYFDAVHAENSIEIELQEIIEIAVV